MKLTTYFGERDRAGHDRLADALFDLYGRHGVHASVMLRGVGGFGLTHHLRTDQLLSLSEDLPAVSVAIDTRERIDALLPDVLAIKRRGLLTLERARMLTGDLPPVALPEDLHEGTKLTVYVGRQERVHRVPAFDAVCELLHRRGLSGATVLLGVDGTVHGERARAAFFSRNSRVPMMIVCVGTGQQIARVLPELGGLLRNPTVTLERVRICKRDGELLTRPRQIAGTDEHGLANWQKLMVHTSETARVGGKPLHRAIVERLREANIAGATSIRGIWGFHGDRAPHGDKLLQVYRHTPVVTIVVDTPERIGTAFEIVDGLTRGHGLVTSEVVPAMQAMTATVTRGGTRLARRAH